MAEAAFDYLNGEDLPALPAAVQAECLKSWARLTAKQAAAEAGLVAAFWAADGPAADGQKSMAAWLMRFGRCTKPAARGMVAASFRVREHRRIDRALCDGAISPSYARWIGDAVGRFAAADREAVEEILVEAGAAGAMVEDLEKVATAALRRLGPGEFGRTEMAAHADRGLTLSKTIGGVGRLNGDLDAEATALAETVVGALSGKAGPEDDRTARQRRHDALAEALRRLLASGLLPERGGTKPHLKIDMDLATLRGLPGAKQAEDAWVARQAAELAARRGMGATTRDLLADLRTSPPPATAAQPRQPGKRAAAQPASPGVHRGRDVVVDDLAGQTVVDPLVRQTLGSGASLAGIGAISGGLAAALGCESIVTPTLVGAVDRDALALMTTAWLHAHGIGGSGAGGPDTLDTPGRDRSGDTSLATTPAAPETSAALAQPPPYGRRESRPAGRAAQHDGPAGRGHGSANATIDGPGVPARVATLSHHDGGPGGRTTRQCAERCRGCLSGHGCRNAVSGHGDAESPRSGVAATTFLRLQESMLRWAIDVLSGPGGLASYLRTGLLDGPLTAPSIVLDVGADSRTVPAALERAVRRRDARCRFPGCDQPAELGQVHHLIPVAEGGPTQLWNLLCLCSFHHLIAVHGWGWTLRLRPDGTVTATGPDGRVLHEANPPGDPPLRAA
jgi:hypothetical protein